MKKRKRRSSPVPAAALLQSLPAAITLDREEFSMAINVANAAGSFRMPMEKTPREYHVDLQFEDGRIQRIVPTDIPENRQMLAILDFYKGDRDKSFSTMMRYFALRDVMFEPEMKEWIKADDDNPERQWICAAVYYAAAETPLNAEGRFDKADFFERVKRIGDEYTDEVEDN